MRLLEATYTIMPHAVNNLNAKPSSRCLPRRLFLVVLGVSNMALRVVRMEVRVLSWSRWFRLVSAFGCLGLCNAPPILIAEVLERAIAIYEENA